MRQLWIHLSKATISQSDDSKDHAKYADYANDGDADSIVSSVPSGQSCLVVPRPATLSREIKAKSTATGCAHVTVTMRKNAHTRNMQRQLSQAQRARVI